MDFHTDDTNTGGKGWQGPAIGLLDLDAFFASVEQLDHPEWRGKPLIVGGDADKRGVVSTASYEARAYGVHSAMASAQARKLCPQAIWTQGHYDRYREMSSQVMGIINAETPYVEQVSIDEAFFDITPGRFSNEDPVIIVRRMADKVAELGITCSIGLAANKTTAKIASERNKPHGITVVYPGMQADFLAPLPVRTMSGIGGQTEKVLAELGIQTLGQLADADPKTLSARLGVMGPRLIERAAGREISSVEEREAPDQAKSVSNERTFSTDLTTRDEAWSAIGYISATLARRLRHKDLAGSVVTLKVSYSYGHTRTARKQLQTPTDDERVLVSAAKQLLDNLWKPGMSIRLMGIGVSSFDRSQEPEQLNLFDIDSSNSDETIDTAQTIKARERAKKLERASDDLRMRFGDNALVWGSELKFKERVSNTAPLHKEDD